MTSIKEVQKIEQVLIDGIAAKEAQIKDLQQAIREQQHHLESIRQSKHTFQEEAFLKLYGKTAKQVRMDYIDLVRRCMKSCTLGHSVKIPGLVIEWGSHVCLLPEHYEVCKPTPLIIEAFATVGQEVYIEPEAHKEHWGN